MNVICFSRGPIDIKRLPKRVAQKAQQVIDKLDDGVSWQDLGGRVMKDYEHVVSVPVGKKHRLLVERTGLKPIKVMAHEEYNRKWRWKGRA